MIAAFLLRTYFNLNLALFVSVVAWVISVRFTKKRSSSGQELRMAQLLVVMSLVLPFVLMLTPTKKLPINELGYFMPAAEGYGKLINSKAHTQLDTPASSAENVVPTKLSIIQKLMSNMNWQGWLLAFIILGTGFFGTKFSVNLWKLAGILKRSTIHKKIHHSIIAFSEEITVPFSVIFGRQAWVVLPLDILFTQKDFKLAVRHELQHHRQRDTHWALFFEFVQCLFYLNPAIYFWKKKINEFQELSCDEALIGQSKVSARDYASCLVRVAEAALRDRQMYAGTACMAANSRNPDDFKSFLRRRIEMLPHYEKSTGRSWRRIITGTLAAMLVAVAAYGIEQSARNLAEINPGVATVDEPIQKITKKILVDWVKTVNASQGFAIVADPATGHVLATVNVDGHGNENDESAQSLVMEAASIGKTIVAAEAIEKGLTSPQEKHACGNGSYQFGGRVYHDWKDTGWDFLTTEETITHSSDICSMKIGEKIGAQGLYEMLVRFGFGPDGTAKSFPGAVPGQLPPKNYSDQSSLIPQISAGFGYKITPIEMVQAYGAIANGGNLMEPKPANATGSQVIRRVLTSETSMKIKEILKQVVLKGTGELAASDLYTTAGKTASAVFSGTQKIVWLGGKEKKSDYAGFIGFAPVNHPQIEVFVGIRTPDSRTGAHGRTHAGPVFRRITEEVLKHMKVAPDKMEN